MTTLQEAAKQALVALNLPLAGNRTPAAYLTRTEQGDMVWTPEMYGEACTYCDEGEFPIPLYTATPAVALQPQTDAEYQHMTANGAKAWAGVDPQELRTGAVLADAEIIAIAERTKTAEPGRDGYVLPISFARAILATQQSGEVFK